METVQADSQNRTSSNLKGHQFKQNVLFYCENIWDQMKLILRNIGAYDFIDKIALLSIKHPYLAISGAIFIIAFLLPIIFILVFILSTILMAFTGFVLIEGTLITIASVILFGCLGAILIVFLFFGVITIVGYFGFMHVYDLHNNLNQQTAIKKFLINERNKINS